MDNHAQSIKIEERQKFINREEKPSTRGEIMM
jgi:hypothetical protein